MENNELSRTEIDNSDIIRNLLKFQSDDDFYFLQILQRKKDHKKGKINGSNNNSRLIKAYYIKSLDHYDFIIPEVIELCRLFNARAGINLNKRSFKRSQLHTMKKILDQQLNGEYRRTHQAFNSVCGMYSNETDKKWIIDLDKEEINLAAEIGFFLMKLMPNIGEPKVYISILSNNGLHLITSPFDLEEFRTKYKV